MKKVLVFAYRLQQSKGEEILVKLLLKKKCAGGTVHGICKCEKQEIYFVEAVKQACRDFLRYEGKHKV